MYTLENRITGEKFAAKTFFKSKVFEKDSGKESIINEINILRKINHKNLLKLYEIFETENSFYIITNLLSGGTLLKRIRSIHHLNEIQTAIMCKNILSGL